MYQRRLLILQNLVLVTTEKMCGNFYVTDSCDDPRVQKRMLDVVLRLDGMLSNLIYSGMRFRQKPSTDEKWNMKFGIMGAIKKALVEDKCGCWACFFGSGAEAGPRVSFHFERECSAECSCLRSSCLLYPMIPSSSSSHQSRISFCN